MMKLKPLPPLMPMASILFFFGCTHRPVDRSIRGWDHMMGYGGYGGMLMWLILIIVAGIIIYFVFNQNKFPDNSKNASKESPTDILKRRYAKGEITKEELETLKKEIES